jgi:hypothetical protein
LFLSNWIHIHLDIILSLTRLPSSSSSLLWNLFQLFILLQLWIKFINRLLLHKFSVLLFLHSSTFLLFNSLQWLLINLIHSFSSIKAFLIVFLRFIALLGSSSIWKSSDFWCSYLWTWAISTISTLLLNSIFVEILFFAYNYISSCLHHCQSCRAIWNLFLQFFNIFFMFNVFRVFYWWLCKMNLFQHLNIISNLSLLL